MRAQAKAYALSKRREETEETNADLDDNAHIASVHILYMKINMHVINNLLPGLGLRLGNNYLHTLVQYLNRYYLYNAQKNKHYIINRNGVIVSLTIDNKYT